MIGMCYKFLLYKNVVTDARYVRIHHHKLGQRCYYFWQSGLVITAPKRVMYLQIRYIYLFYLQDSRHFFFLLWDGGELLKLQQNDALVSMYHNMILVSKKNLYHKASLIPWEEPKQICAHIYCYCKDKWS